MAALSLGRRYWGLGIGYSIAGGRQREGYAILELHGIVHIREQHLRQTIASLVSDEAERKGLLALPDAVLDAVRMVLGVRYALSVGR